MTATQNRVKVGPVELVEHTEEMKFTIPAKDKVRPEFADKAGTSFKKTFSFGQITVDKVTPDYPAGATDEEKSQLDKEAEEYAAQEANEIAQAVAEHKGWTLVDFVNDSLKSAARSASYQNELAKYAPITTTTGPEEIKERMVKDYIRLGFSEEQARNLVTSALASK